MSKREEKVPFVQMPNSITARENIARRGSQQMTAHEQIIDDGIRK